MKYSLLYPLFFSSFLFLACQTTSQKQAGQSDEELFKKAQSAVKRGAYVTAEETIEQLKYKYPYSPFSVRADLLRADMAYEQNNWEQAQRAYKVFMNLYPSNKEISYAYFRHILSLNHLIPEEASRDLSMSDEIMDVIKVFQKKFPKSSYLKQVGQIHSEIYNRIAQKEFEIGKFYFKKKSYSATLKRLDQVIEKYKDSTWYKPSLDMAQKIAKILKNKGLQQKYSKKNPS